MYLTYLAVLAVLVWGFSGLVSSRRLSARLTLIAVASLLSIGLVSLFMTTLEN